MTDRPNVPTLLAEVAEVLRRHGTLECVPDVEIAEDRTMRVTIFIAPEASGAVEDVGQGLDLFHALQYLRGLAQVRAFVRDYGLDGLALTALLPKHEEPTLGAIVDRISETERMIGQPNDIDPDPTWAGSRST